MCVSQNDYTTRSSCFITGAQECVRATPLNGPMYHNETKGPATHCDAAHLGWGVPKLGGRCGLKTYTHKFHLGVLENKNVDLAGVPKMRAEALSAGGP